MGLAGSEHSLLVHKALDPKTCVTEIVQKSMTVDTGMTWRGHHRSLGPNGGAERPDKQELD